MGRTTVDEFRRVISSAGLTEERKVGGNSWFDGEGIGSKGELST